MSMSNTEKTVKNIAVTPAASSPPRRKHGSSWMASGARVRLLNCAAPKPSTPTLYYRWSKNFLKAGKRRLSRDTVREANTDEVTGTLEDALEATGLSEARVRYRQSLDNVTPADVYEGRRNDILNQRAVVEYRTLSQRKVHTCN